MNRNTSYVPHYIHVRVGLCHNVDTTYGISAKEADHGRIWFTEDRMTCNVFWKAWMHSECPTGINPKCWQGLTPMLQWQGWVSGVWVANARAQSCNSTSWHKSVWNIVLIHSVSQFILWFRNKIVPSKFYSCFQFSFFFKKNHITRQHCNKTWEIPSQFSFELWLLNSASRYNFFFDALRLSTNSFSPSIFLSFLLNKKDSHWQMPKMYLADRYVDRNYTSLKHFPACETLVFKIHKKYKYFY